MNKEGAGKIKPPEEQIWITRPFLEHMKAISNERTERNSYSVSSDLWKRGFIADPVFIGTVAEAATYQFLQQKQCHPIEWNLGPISGGDRGVDILCNGKALQVKATTRNGHSNLVRRTRGRAIEDISSVDIFVFARVTDSDPQRVFLKGWLHRKQVERGVFMQSTRAEHYNLVIDDSELEPMSRLVTALKLWL